MVGDYFGSTVVFDVETVASPNAEMMLDPVRAPANYKDPTKIAAYQQEKMAERVATAGLDPDLCEVVALGYQRNADCQVYTRLEGSEQILLDWFWERVDNSRLVGFNILNFDLLVLMRRSQLLGIDYPNLNTDRYRTPHLDLLEYLSFHGRLPYRSLNFYCRRFGIASDDTIAGADITGLVAAEQWEAVRTHCESDIRKTALLAGRLGKIRMAEVA